MNNSNLKKLNNNIKMNDVNKSNIRYVIMPNNYSMASKLFGIILLLVVMIVIISGSYWLYNYYNTNTFANSQEVDVMTDVKNANSKFTVVSGSIPNSNYSNEYSMSCWINIQDYNYNYGTEKVILRRGEKGSGNPEIVLAAKTNDLIVRIKLQGSNKVSAFTDIPIPINFNSNNTLKRETVNITSLPAPVNFDSNTTNDISIFDSNMNIGENMKLGENKVDYPTIQYISNNSQFNDNYFSMISGNNVKTDNIIETFDNVTDAINTLVTVFIDTCDITSYLQNIGVKDDPIDINSVNVVFNKIIDYIESIKDDIATNTTTNLDIISTILQQKSTDLNIVSNNTQFSNKLDKLKADIAKLNDYNGVIIDYSILQTTLNTKMNSINCKLTLDGTIEKDGVISLLNKLSNLLRTTLNTFIGNLSGTINNQINQTARCIVDTNNNTDPTIGTCVVKMIPLQKWVHIIVSVYNQIVDIYIDGQLASSCVLKQFPTISTTDATITPDGGFAGMISRVKFTNTAMTVSEAKHIYNQGPVLTTSLLASIPNWVYWSIFIIIMILIIFSFLA